MKDVHSDVTAGLLLLVYYNWFIITGVIALV